MAPSRNAGRKPAPTPVRRRATKAAPVDQPRPRPATKSAPIKDVSKWATQAPTDYHRKFAQWIVREVGYDPDSAQSQRAAFLAGVSIATASRNAFMGSDFLAEWRASEGLAKPGRRPTSEASEPSKRRKPAPIEDFDDDASDDDDEYNDAESDDDEFADDEGDDGENYTDEFDDDVAEDEEIEEEPEPAPAPKRRGRPVSKPAPTRKAAPAARKTGVPPRGKARTAPKTDDDDYVF